MNPKWKSLPNGTEEQAEVLILNVVNLEPVLDKVMTLNGLPFGGRPVGTVMMTSVAYDCPRRRPDGARLWDCRVTVAYKPWGWNTRTIYRTADWPAVEREPVSSYMQCVTDPNLQRVLATSVHARAAFVEAEMAGKSFVECLTAALVYVSDSMDRMTGRYVDERMRATEMKRHPLFLGEFVGSKAPAYIGKDGRVYSSSTEAAESYIPPKFKADGADEPTIVEQP